MTLQISKELKRIALLFVIMGLLAGLACPAACDEFYNNLLKLSGQSSEIRSVYPGPVTDCISSSETSGYNPYRPVVRRSGSARPDLLRLTGNGSLCFLNTFHNNHLSLLLLVLLTCTAALSYYHIIYIHLKDGQK